MASSRMATLQNQITELKTRFDGLRADVVEKLNECTVCITSAEECYQEIKEMATHLEDQLANVSNEEKEWQETKVKLAMTSIKGMVILNVGGEEYTTSVETLTSEKNTFFTALFSKQWQLERDSKDGTIFIDRNGKLFTYILEYFRTNIVLDDVMKDEILRQKLLIEAKYFGLHSLIDVLTKPSRAAEVEQKQKAGDFLNGTLLTTEQKMKLNEFYGKPEPNWELIYRASRDGFGASAFHTRCDNQKSTMVVVRSTNNYLFGGYASAAWIPDVGAYISDPVNPQNIASALQYSKDYGPIFGGCDIAVYNNSNSTETSRFNLGSCYVDTTGQGASTFTGATTFTTLDIEIFKLS